MRKSHRQYILTLQLSGMGGKKTKQDRVTNKSPEQGGEVAIREDDFFTLFFDLHGKRTKKRSKLFWEFPGGKKGGKRKTTPSSIPTKGVPQIFVTHQFEVSSSQLVNKKTKASAKVLFIS